jgi:hypothetical protein
VQIGICEGAGLVKWLLCAKVVGGVDVALSSWVRARASKAAGVEVERPQPEARTNDLDAGAGWRMLDVEDDALGC